MVRSSANEISFGLGNSCLRTRKEYSVSVSIVFEEMYTLHHYAGIVKLGLLKNLFPGCKRNLLSYISSYFSKLICGSGSVNK